MKEEGIEKIVFSEEQIQAQVAKMAEMLSRDYAGKDPIIVGILRGCFYFLADLTRYMTIPVSIDFLSIGVYPEMTKKTGIVRFNKELDTSIKNRHVLLVEDIVGTGLTLSYICQHLEAYNPASLKICTLLDNPKERLLALNIDYSCFVMPDSFLVGYGLDYEQKYRNLPYIAAYRQEKQR
ncbi:MAG: hypoxanthine phosphoribosyltransferase [Caldicoprobacterales bacterium]|jgi:hypoxanthine phosphoribosyltransferase|nr:hypoxanthine phosphoribosyltransferase [Clostridiales bacterium]